MATTSLHPESDCAIPAALNLHTAALGFEAIAAEIGEIAVLAHLLSSTDDINPAMSKALRAVSQQLTDAATRAEGQSEAFLTAHSKAKGASA